MATMTRRPALWMLPVGLLGGHFVGSWLGQRAGASGLGDWGLLGVGLLLVGIPAAVAGLRSFFTAGRVGQPITIRRLFAELVVLQAVAFLGLEIAEHVVADGSVGHLLAHGACWWGLVGQVLVAVALLLLAQLTIAAGDAFARAARRPVPRPVRQNPCPTADLVPDWLIWDLFRRRGPPVLFAHV